VTVQQLALLIYYNILTSVYANYIDNTIGIFWTTSKRGKDRPGTDTIMAVQSL